ncbi:MAG: hypothetical protein CM15mV16_0250 [uncultured marine virus]|nr:MAG: hypothetical protein CM15mV16_0250 [uncultured marine virus]|tara:strand:+ start:103 stop:714 length:612 start_codon:yes stop_codon:yes gene_type:complete
MTNKVKPQDKPHYVNNKEFSLAVVDYCNRLQKAQKQKSKKIPVIDNYIAECFLKIAEGLSHKSNFIRYTYREEMVMDAVENCLKAIKNYDIETATRTGTPNAFAYFTQIAWYAFLRRIDKEKKQQDIKLKYMANIEYEDLVDNENSTEQSDEAGQFLVDTLRQKIDDIKSVDRYWKDVVTEEKKKRKRRAVNVDSDLKDFLSD